MEVSNIPFARYDVIFYIGANAAQYGDGTGKIVFNGAPERDFKVKSGLFDGTFTEMGDTNAPGNYIVYRMVTGSSFTAKTWGMGPNNGFNHIGPTGFQIREMTLTLPVPTFVNGVPTFRNSERVRFHLLAGLQEQPDGSGLDPHRRRNTRQVAIIPSPIPLRPTRRSGSIGSKSNNGP